MVGKTTSWFPDVLGETCDARRQVYVALSHVMMNNACEGPLLLMMVVSVGI
jgi:hypothetical protein